MGELRSEPVGGPPVPPQSGAVFQKPVTGPSPAAETPEGGWIDVESSTIAAIKRPSMLVRFKSGAVYEYDGVSEEDFQKVRDAESVGRALHQHIRGRYPHRRLDQREETDVNGH